MDNKVQVPVTETERNSKMKISSSMRPVVLAAGLGGPFTVVNLACAQTWTPTRAPSAAWNSVASSADGTKLVAAGRGGGYWGSTRQLQWTART